MYEDSLFTRGHLAYGYCHCLRLCECQLLLVRAITHHPLKLGSPNLDQKMQNILLKVPIVFWSWLNLIFQVKFNFSFKVLFICIAFVSLKYLWDLQKRMKNVSVPHPKIVAHICAHPKASCHGPWNSWVVSLVWPFLASLSSTRRFGNEFECFCRLSPNHTYLTCRHFVCQYSVIAETTVKQRAVAFIVFESQHWVNRLSLRRAIFSAVDTAS